MKRWVNALAIFSALLIGAAACSSSDADVQAAAETITNDEPAESEEPAEPATPTTTVDEAQESATELGVASAEPTLGEDFPDIIGVRATQEESGTWRFDVTVSSPYDTPERYADGWRVVDSDGNELGFRLLTHDHASEQPFTRSLNGVEIADDISEVTIQGRDQANGWGGGELSVTLR